MSGEKKRRSGPVVVELREAGPADAEAMAGLFTQLGYPMPADVLAARLARLQAGGHGTAVVAIAEDQVVGTGTVDMISTVHYAGDICRLTALVIDEQHRGMGVGRQIVDWVESHARASGCVRVEVTSAFPRIAAHEFYLGIGYQDKPKRFVKDL